jgi:hypothetical protein
MTDYRRSDRPRTRRRPYGGSEVIHQAGGQSQFRALERERPQIVNNFASSASPGYELSSSSAG